MKKWMILAAAILVVLGIGFAVKGASDKKQGTTPEETAVPETTTSAPNEEAETADALREETETTETEDGAEEIDTLCGQITEINDEYLILEGTQQGTVQVNIFDDTLYNGLLQQGELAVGQYAEVIYDGKMTRSIPAQIAALAINEDLIKQYRKMVVETGGTITMLKELLAKAIEKSVRGLQCKDRKLQHRYVHMLLKNLIMEPTEA